MPRRRPEFESGEAVAEAAKLKKFSDAGGSQNLWLPDAGRFTLFGQEQYISTIESTEQYRGAKRAKKLN